jgi:hypothetical protein
MTGSLVVSYSDLRELMRLVRPGTTDETDLCDEALTKH